MNATLRAGVALTMVTLACACGGASSDDAAKQTQATTPSERQGGKDAASACEPACLPHSAACTTNADCCSNRCVFSTEANESVCFDAAGDAGSDSAPACLPHSAPCTTNAECCSNNCVFSAEANGSVCFTANPGCAAGGEACATSSDCCSFNCDLASRTCRLKAN